MKKLTVILMVLFAGIILAGCTSQTAPVATTAPTEVPTVAPTEAPTAEPTPEVVVTAEPTAVPTTVAPTATPTPIPDKKIKVAQTLTFDPNGTTIPAGTKVIFYTDAVGYKFKVAISGANFNAISDIITPETSWSYTFTKPGTYTLEEQIYPQFHDDDVKIVVT